MAQEEEKDPDAVCLADLPASDGTDSSGGWGFFGNLIGKTEGGGGAGLVL